MGNHQFRRVTMVPSIVAWKPRCQLTTLQGRIIFGSHDAQRARGGAGGGGGGSGPSQHECRNNLHFNACKIPQKFGQCEVDAVQIFQLHSP